MRPFVRLVPVFALTIACSVEMPPEERDAAVDTDASAPLDAAPPDAGMDAASVPDAGATRDASTPGDAETPDDGGIRDDAGMLEDAMVGLDAGPPDAGGCTSDAACATDEHCAAGRCVPDVCDPAPPGDRPFCDGGAILRCRANGSGYDVLQTCLGGRACRESATSPYAECLCVQEGTLSCRSTDNDVYEVDSCGNYLRRVQDCVLAARESCVADDAGARCATPTTCTTSSSCAASDWCDAGRCVPDVCNPAPPGNRPFCDGAVVRVCRADGSGYDLVEDCSALTTGEVCVTLGGAPYADCRCQANARLGCDNTDIYSFDSCGARGSLVAYCTSPRECQEGPAGPSCELVSTCTRDGDCGAGRTCDGGSCVPQLCTPGAERCEGERAERCDARGTRWETLDECAGGESCAASGGTARCTCASSSALGCSATDIYHFDACGDRQALSAYCTSPEECIAGASGPVCADPATVVSAPCVADLDCASGQICIAGSCASRTCTPNAAYCAAGAVRRCDARGEDSVLVDDCDGGTECVADGTGARCACVPSARVGCDGGHVYDYDSCGQRGAIRAWCTGTATCVESAGTAGCVSPLSGGSSGPTCTERASQGCYLGDLYWLDSCGVPTELAEACAGSIFCNSIGGPAACRSSVADDASPWYTRSCPLVQDIEDPTTLPADCRCFENRTPSSGIDRCIGALYVPVSTRIGAGPAIRPLPQRHLNGGVIVGRELMVGVDWSSGTRPQQGLVLAVDLDTGDRRIVSGGYEDPALGFVETGSGPSLHKVIDVAHGAGGSLYALSVPAATPNLEIVRIDPATGNRTRIWRGRDAAYGQCASGDPARTSVTYHDRVFGIAPSGEYYLGFRGAGSYSEGVGIVRIAADGSSCAFVTRSGAGALSAYAGADVGGGYALDRGFYAGLVSHDGALYVLNDVYNALFRVDPATGHRTRVSSASTSWGVLGAGPTSFGGLGQRWLAWDAGRNVMWASGLQSYRGLTAVDLSSGDRTEAYCRPVNPSVPWRDTCLGGVLEGGYQNFGGFWIDPVNGDPIVAHESYALVRVDLRNGNSMRFSL